jgi:hypothetical protein
VSVHAGALLGKWAGFPSWAVGTWGLAYDFDTSTLTESPAHSADVFGYFPPLGAGVGGTFLGGWSVPDVRILERYNKCEWVTTAVHIEDLGGGNGPEPITYYWNRWELWDSECQYLKQWYEVRRRNGTDYYEGDYSRADDGTETLTETGDANAYSWAAWWDNQKDITAVVADSSATLTITATTAVGSNVRPATLSPALNDTLAWSCTLSEVRTVAATVVVATALLSLIDAIPGNTIVDCITGYDLEGEPILETVTILCGDVYQVTYDYFPKQAVWELIGRITDPPTTAWSDFRGRLIVGDAADIWAQKSRFKVGDPDDNCAGLNDVGSVEQIGPVENTLAPWDGDDGTYATWVGGGTTCVDANYAPRSTITLGPSNVEYDWGFCEPTVCP